jgi:hypothetical protein
MPSQAEQAQIEMEREIRRSAQRLTIDHHFTPRVLLENTPEAFATFLVTYFPPQNTHGGRPGRWSPSRSWFLEPRALILVPAGTMKTTIGAELKQIWRLCQCPDYEILGVFKNDIEAKKCLKAIKWEFMFNDKLIADYGRSSPLARRPARTSGPSMR